MHDESTSVAEEMGDSVWGGNLSLNPEAKSQWRTGRQYLHVLSDIHGSWDIRITFRFKIGAICSNKVAQTPPFTVHRWPMICHLTWPPLTWFVVAVVSPFCPFGNALRVLTFPLIVECFASPHHPSLLDKCLHPVLIKEQLSGYRQTWQRIVEGGQMQHPHRSHQITGMSIRLLPFDQGAIEGGKPQP